VKSLTFALSLVLSSCSFVRGGDFATALSELRAGDQGWDAREAFESACRSADAAACQLLGLPFDAKALSPLGIVQGPTSARSTQLAVLHSRPRGVELILWEVGSLRWVDPVAVDEKTFPDSPWKVVQARFDGLQRSKEYLLQVVDLPSRRLLDGRRLRTLDTGKPTVRFAVASCMDDSYTGEQASMWGELLEKRPDVLFLIGDNVYADFPIGVPPPDPAALWRRYAETRSRLAVFRADPLVPIVATWDDHDYGANDGDSGFAHKAEAARTFAAYFPQEPIADVFERGPGVSSRLIVFGQQFFFMDDRSFRSPVGAKPETHWGAEQEKWLSASLGRGAAPAWIFNGDQFFGGYHRFESYEGRHPRSFAGFHSLVRRGAVPAVLVSGDRHLAELMRIPAGYFGFTTFELTTSAIHAKTFPDAWKDSPNRRKIEGASGVLNYAVVESAAPTRGAISARIRAFGPGSSLLFERQVRISR